MRSWDHKDFRFWVSSKKFFFDFFPFSPNARGPPKIFNVQFFKFFGKWCQKWLNWVLASTKRYKVMKFFDSNPGTLKMAADFMVAWAIMACPVWNRVNVKSPEFNPRAGQWNSFKTLQLYFISMETLNSEVCSQSKRSIIDLGTTCQFNSWEINCQAV